MMSFPPESLPSTAFDPDRWANAVSYSLWHQESRIAFHQKRSSQLAHHCSQDFVFVNAEKHLYFDAEVSTNVT